MATKTAERANGKVDLAELKAQVAQEEKNERRQRANLFMEGYNHLVASTGVQVRAGWRPAVGSGGVLKVEAFEALVDVESGEVIDVLETRPR